MSILKSVLCSFGLLTMFYGTTFASEPDRLEIPVLRFSGFSFQPGLRIQVRYSYDQETESNDIMIRRTRLKARGGIFDIATYYFELKIDNVGREGVDSAAKVENAYVEFPVRDEFAVRIGQFDVPFTRSQLTSDSKLLFMDRALITGALAGRGLADNTQGLLIFGRPWKGRFEYAGGIFDNERVEGTPGLSLPESTELMIAGRFALNFLDPPPPTGYGDYRGSYIGKGRRLRIGTNMVRQGNVRDQNSQFDLWSWGVDLFSNYEAFTLEAEYDRFYDNHRGQGWYIQAGYVLPLATSEIKFEPAVRFQRFDPAASKSIDRISWFSVGLNIYIRNHNLKVQTDLTIREERNGHDRKNIFQTQLQLDF